VNAKVEKKPQVVQTIRLHKECPTLGESHKTGKMLIPNENKHITVDGRMSDIIKGGVIRWLPHQEA
jgi:hypothetical protein